MKNSSVRGRLEYCPRLLNGAIVIGTIFILISLGSNFDRSLFAIAAHCPPRSADFSFPRSCAASFPSRKFPGL